jgi:hypothetical protein
MTSKINRLRRHHLSARSRTNLVRKAKASTGRSRRSDLNRTSYAEFVRARSAMTGNGPTPPKPKPNPGSPKRPDPDALHKVNGGEPTGSKKH